MKKIRLIVLSLCALAACVLPARAAARSTMLVVPARYSVLQVAFDITRGFPVVLVSYQGDATSESPRLHVWNGQEWVKISVDDYRQGTFLQYTPDQAVLVGDETLLPPVLSGTVSQWSPKVIQVPSIDTATLVNSFGRIFGFNSADWEWYSKRYNLTLNDLNAPKRQQSWYDRSVYEDKYSHKFGRGGSGQGPAPEQVPPAPVIQSEVPPAVEPAPAAEEPVIKPDQGAPQAEVAPAAEPQAETPAQ